MVWQFFCSLFIEKIAIIGLQTMWLLPNRIPNVGFVQIGPQTIFLSSNRILVLLIIFSHLPITSIFQY
jgi:hypothetical protein